MLPGACVRVYGRDSYFCADLGKGGGGGGVAHREGWAGAHLDGGGKEARVQRLSFWADGVEGLGRGTEPGALLGSLALLWWVGGAVEL